MNSLLDQLEQRPQPADWFASPRAEAAAQLLASGLPTRKHEAWRFTALAQLSKLPFGPAAPQATAARDVELVEQAFGDEEAHLVVLVDGVPVRGAQGLPGVQIRALRHLLADDPAEWRGLLGSLAPAQHFAALNTALFTDGLLVSVDAGQRLARPLHLVHVTRAPGTPTLCHPRTLLTVGESAEAQVVETFLTHGDGSHLTNAVTEVRLEANAQLEHMRVLEGASQGFHLGNLAVRQARDSRYVSRVATLGGALSRLDLRVELAEPGAECVLDGVYLAQAGEHVEHQTVVEHLAPRCSSQESYRGIADGKGTAVFDGMAVVHRDAQQTSAHQENRNLLLSRDAVVHTKPHLRIDADDVKCSHGATVGTLDADQLFYLRARGVDAPIARAILTYAFVEATVDRIPLSAVRTRLSEAILGRLPEGPVVREVLCKP